MNLLFSSGNYQSPCAKISRLKKTLRLLVLLAFSFWIVSLRAGDLDTIGATVLRQVDPSLLGTGIRVAQVEGDFIVEGGFEVNPVSINNHPTNLFTWISSLGTATNFPNSVGTDSGHAASVANNFYDPSNGIAANVLHVDNYEADYFYNSLITQEQSIPALVVNQSFTFTDENGDHLPTNDEATIDAYYDNFAAAFNVLLVTGAGNGTDDGTIFPSATCYNGLGVGVYPGTSSIGPTYDGRHKPDIVSPGSGATSFATPFVSGAGAVLLQAGFRGDGGANTGAQTDIRTIKALLLNGAIKPADWTNGITAPLDARYGAGVLNVFNSWMQLKGQQHSFIESTSVTQGNPHPPGTNPSNVSVLVGWDFNKITNTPSSKDRINHYYFNLPGQSPFTLTSTLIWNRPAGASLGEMTSINDLNLFLYTANSNLVLCSTSMVDNCEHLYIPSLPPGRYDLQVEKNASGAVSNMDTYAVAFEFFSLSLSISQSNNNAVITWPLAPTGFELQSTTNLSPPTSWSPVAQPVAVDTNLFENVVVVPLNGANQFFRLQRP